MEKTTLPIKSLQVGHYVVLNLGWSDHPFLFSRFKIKSRDQIQILKNLGLKEVQVILEKSDLPTATCTSGESASPDAADTTPEQNPDPAQDETALLKQQDETKRAEALWKDKQKRIERVKVINDRQQKCTRKYQKSLQMVRSVMKDLKSAPLVAVTQADEVISNVVDTLFDESGIMVHLMSTEGAFENAYYHSLNVSVLAMLIGKELQLDADTIRVLGIGALFHDVGKNKIPSRVLAKKEPLTEPEEILLKHHPKYGADIVSRIETFPKNAIDIITQHHECMDGSGYPRWLEGEQISLLARITSIVNVYDNLCNHPDPDKSLTPSEALAQMFKFQLEKYDRKILELFIRSMGVYPPGTIVELSNGVLGMVVSINSDNLLCPTLLLYDQEIPREEAICIDMLEEKDLTIQRTIKPSQLEPDAYSYFNPRTQINYFFDSKQLKDTK
jgi:putative nucleotidyltransferase with HDIG domain